MVQGQPRWLVGSGISAASLPRCVASWAPFIPEASVSLFGETWGKSFSRQSVQSRCLAKKAVCGQKIEHFWVCCPLCPRPFGGAPPANLSSKGQMAPSSPWKPVLVRREEVVGLESKPFQSSHQIMGIRTGGQALAWGYLPERDPETWPVQVTCLMSHGCRPQIPSVSCLVPFTVQSHCPCSLAVRGLEI